MKETLADAVDLSTVVMTHYNLRQVSAGSLGLSTPAIDPSYVPTASDVGTGKAKDAEMVKLQQLIAKLNDLFEGELSENDLLNYARTVSDKITEQSVLVQQFQANTEAQFAASTDFKQAVQNAVVKAYDSNSKMTSQVLSNELVMTGFRDVVLQLFADKINKGGGAVAHSA
jgi:type I restriction enzyme R subunit